jgi:hypothetical protein
MEGYMRMLLRAAAWTLLLIALALFIRAAPAEERPRVDLALVLAVDVSGSVGLDGFGIQRDGYVTAFRDPEVIEALTSGPLGRIAVTLVLWHTSQKQVLPWILIGSSVDAYQFSALTASTHNLYGGSTAVKRALDYSIGLLRPSPNQPFVMPARRIIDISGDGRDNVDLDPRAARDKAISRNITINALPILKEGGESYLVEYYEGLVAGGPGSFVLPAKSYGVFGESIRKKLIKEVAMR